MAILTCNDGFSRTGNAFVTCQSNGTWSGVTICTETGCRTFECKYNYGHYINLPVHCFLEQTNQVLNIILDLKTKTLDFFALPYFKCWCTGYRPLIHSVHQIPDTRSAIAVYIPYDKENNPSLCRKSSFVIK